MHRIWRLGSQLGWLAGGLGCVGLAVLAGLAGLLACLLAGWLAGLLASCWLLEVRVMRRRGSKNFQHA